MNELELGLVVGGCIGVVIGMIVSGFIFEKFTFSNGDEK